MAKCEICGNDDDKTFHVVMAGESYTFDCFECAVFALAPRCASCSVHIIGHGVERDGKIYCCDHCATGQRWTGVR